MIPMILAPRRGQWILMRLLAAPPEKLSIGQSMILVSKAVPAWLSAVSLALDASTLVVNVLMVILQATLHGESNVQSAGNQNLEKPWFQLRVSRLLLCCTEDVALYTGTVWHVFWATHSPSYLEANNQVTPPHFKTISVDAHAAYCCYCKRM